ncbi:hypothetical protein [Phaeobacter inhibens]|uniref:hypothetical protein n=1 Tax=Phaeobacter inhibens TaxID=221822 RepID=UPI000C9CD9D2|nr:hypothetical protein [Phaeobacter inhibens]AUQ54514.1 hypothetical protein PhaeoP92_01837 [Phaeobacter inhibens]AUQ78530.1 hypothetical protein PhaeoP74_01838 [Phaeobacter inhibens]AUR15689.1 hypothetical protein PhaeoP70_01836 [Phaeobacter inhibens]
MEKQTKAQKSDYKVASAFVWDGKIQKPGMKVSLTKTEAHGLMKRGKIEEVKTRQAPAKKTEVAKPAATKSAAAKD